LLVVLDASDDPGQDRDEVRIGGDDSLGVGLGRADLQQRHEFAGGGQVLAQAQVGQLEQLLDAGPGASQDLDGCPGPEGVVLQAFRVEPLFRLIQRGDEERGGAPVAAGPTGPAVAQAVDGELLPRFDRPDGRKEVAGYRQPVLGAGDQLWQDGDQCSGALLHAGLTAAGLLDVPADVGLSDRAWCGPLSPPGGVLQRPLLQVEVQRANGEEHPVRGAPWLPVGQNADPLLPGLRGIIGQVQGADPAVMAFQVRPEQVDQHLGFVDQRAVVEHRRPLREVVHEDVADRLVRDRVAVDELGHRQLAAGRGLAQRRRQTREPTHGA